MNQPRAVIIKNFLYSDSLFYWILENIFYTHSLEDSYIVHNHIDASFLYLFQKDFYIAQSTWALFVFFFFRKISEPFSCFFLKLFFVFFIIVIYNFIRSFFIKSFFIRIFFIRIFSFRIKRNFYIVNNILMSLFFL